MDCDYGRLEIENACCGRSGYASAIERAILCAIFHVYDSMYDFGSDFGFGCRIQTFACV